MHIAPRSRGDSFQPLSADTLMPLLTGREMPLLGLGTWQLKHQTVESVTCALESGYRMIDTSGDYHTQRGIGEALRASGVPREAVYLVTKVEETDDSYAALRTNLAELKLE
jgi:2,5-diketo-D-gluconate reductase A